MTPTRARIGQSWGVGRFFFLILFTVAFTALGIFQVRRQYDVISRGYVVDRELFEYRRELETQKRLSLLLAAYKDPNTLRDFAERELGMRPPERENELFVPGSGSAAPRPLAHPPVPTRSAPPSQVLP